MISEWDYDVAVPVDCDKSRHEESLFACCLVPCLPPTTLLCHHFCCCHAYLPTCHVPLTQHVIPNFANHQTDGSDFGVSLCFHGTFLSPALHLHPPFPFSVRMVDPCMESITFWKNNQHPLVFLPIPTYHHRSILFTYTHIIILLISIMVRTVRALTGTLSFHTVPQNLSEASSLPLPPVFLPCCYYI